MYHMYVAIMSARLFHSSDLDGLREGLAGSDDDRPRETVAARPGRDGARVARTNWAIRDVRDGKPVERMERIPGTGRAG